MRAKLKYKNSKNVTELRDVIEGDFSWPRGNKEPRAIERIDITDGIPKGEARH